MRKINPHDFKVARRGTSREINRQIALNLIRTHQPISRADLARLMNVRRGVASLLVNELLSESLIFEGAVGESVGRGRRPTSLFIDSRQRCVVGVDIRASRTYILVTDLMGRQLGVVSSFQTNREVDVLIQELARGIRQILVDYKEVGGCEGVAAWLGVAGKRTFETSRLSRATSARTCLNRDRAIPKLPTSRSKT